ncbi:hypothetical protein [Nocardia sp. NPDC058480]|uniref:hypothetical protein n=1 Tax=Nocardia sp. NPDC058480 TaxID=3346522 RepID=UPI0036631F81
MAGSRKFEVAGAAHRVVAAGVPLLSPDAQMFDAMLEGWRQQQLSRNLAFSTVDSRSEMLRRFQDHSGEFPWQWTPQHLEEWSTDLRAVRGAALSTVRVEEIVAARDDALAQRRAAAAGRVTSPGHSRAPKPGKNASTAHSHTPSRAVSERRQLHASEVER